MFHVEAEVNVDVELLAECGKIAQRLRSLEQSWNIDLKELQKNRLCNFGKPPLATSLSITQKLNDIFDINENTTDSNPELVDRLRYLEDTVVKIYYQQELLRKTANASHHRLAIKSTMNYSVTSANNDSSHSNNNDLTTISSQDEKDDLDKNEKDQSSTAATTTTNWNKQPQNIYHQQQQLCGKITNDDLNLLLRELMRKVDFTEKMNWLCKLRSNASNRIIITFAYFSHCCFLLFILTLSLFHSTSSLLVLFAQKIYTSLMWLQRRKKDTREKIPFISIQKKIELFSSLFDQEKYTIGFISEHSLDTCVLLNEKGRINIKLSHFK